MENITAADIWFGFIIAFIASASTFMGAMTSLYFKSVNQKTLAVILGFVAGIMLYTAFMKLMPDAIHILSEQLSEKKVKLITTFFSSWGSVCFIRWGIWSGYGRRTSVRNTTSRCCITGG